MKEVDMLKEVMKKSNHRFRHRVDYIWLEDLGEILRENGAYKPAELVLQSITVQKNIEAIYDRMLDDELGLLKAFDAHWIIQENVDYLKLLEECPNCVSRNNEDQWIEKASTEIDVTNWDKWISLFNELKEYGQKQDELIDQLLASGNKKVAGQIECTQVYLMFYYVIRCLSEFLEPEEWGP